MRSLRFEKPEGPFARLARIEFPPAMIEAKRDGADGLRKLRANVEYANYQGEIPSGFRSLQTPACPQARVSDMVLSVGKYASILDLLQRTEALLKEVKRPSMGVTAALLNTRATIAELKTVGIA